MILRFLATYYLLLLSQFIPTSSFNLRNTKNNASVLPIDCNLRASTAVCHLDATKSHNLTLGFQEFDSHYAKYILDAIAQNNLEAVIIYLNMKKNKELLSFALVNSINLKKEDISSMLIHRALTSSDALTIFFEFAKQASVENFKFIYKMIDLSETKSFIPKQIFILAEAGMNGHIGIVQDLINLPLNVFNSLPNDLLIEAIDLKENILDSFIDSTAKLIGLSEPTLASFRIFAYQGNSNILKNKLLNSTAIAENTISSREHLKIALYYQLELLSAIHTRHDCEQKNTLLKKAV